MSQVSKRRREEHRKAGREGGRQRGRGEGEEIERKLYNRSTHPVGC